MTAPPTAPRRLLGYHLRRITFFTLVLLSTLVATGLLSGVFQSQGFRPLELFLLVLYTILFLWLSMSFWTAAMGFWILLWGRDRYSSNHWGAPANRAYRPPTEARTAVLMPIYNEDTNRVFAGLRAIYESLHRTGAIDAFDFYVLSDTRNPDVWVAEELAWQRLCNQLAAGERIFYRNRPINSARKAGNVADFVRTWGDAYRYMIVLDADSLMEGATMVEMVRRMEVNPHTGLLQAPPIPIGHNSLYARILQFAGSLYGPMFTAGLNYWQLAASNFWGHNAIIRTEAFAANCGLPALPGPEPWGGEILSHDFVEAALLRRAGWEVWLAYDLKGSFEELPTTLIDFAKRDRRWCQGNLQHARLVTAAGFGAMSRLHFGSGVMSYLSSPLWFLFLVLTGLEAYAQSREEWVYFFGYNIFPVWPTSYVFEMTTVLLVTLAFLFLPKLMSLLLVIFNSQARRSYGGLFPLVFSVLYESIYATLVAPIMMLFHSRFVLSILLRQDVGWPAQARGDRRTGLREAFLAHWFHTAVGLATGAASYYYVPDFFWWFTPVMAGLLLAIPLSMSTSRSSWGQLAARLGLFHTPQETQPPDVLRRARKYLAATSQQSDAPPTPAWYQAVVLPQVNALHLALLPVEEEPVSRRRRHYLEGLLHQVEEDGPGSLTLAEQRALLSCPGMLRRLHTYIWTTRPRWAVPLLESAPITSRPVRDPV